LQNAVFDLYSTGNSERNFCNYNATILMSVLQHMPKYATNLTVDFNLPFFNAINSGQTVTCYAHNSITLKPCFRAQRAVILLQK
jgi:hypothetical protein